MRASHGIELQIQIPDANAERLDERARGMVSRTGCGLCGVETIDDALRVPATRRHALRRRRRRALASRRASCRASANDQQRDEHRARRGLGDSPTGELHVVREDVGRHNALDKVLGALARDAGSTPTDGFIVMTSRASYEMVQKAAIVRRRVGRGHLAPDRTGHSIRRGGRRDARRLAARRTDRQRVTVVPNEISTPADHPRSDVTREHVSAVPSDIEIAQRVKMRPIEDVAAELGLERDELDLYGKYKAKIPLEVSQRPIRGRLVVVTATNPTPAGEGKSTVSVGLAQALRRMGKKVALCIREPSLGPVFGVKGGAAGGGYAQVVPMDDINLHFTGDFHAISSAHALLAAMLDNHLQQGNALGIDPRRITWPRTIDMNDRALRNCIIGLGGVGDGDSARRAFRHHPGERNHGDRRAGDEPAGSRGASGANHRRRDRRRRASVR